MKKKISILIMISLLLALISTNVFAAKVSSEKSTFEIVENNICTINLNDKATFEKKIINYDLNKKEVTIQLKITNNSVEPIVESTPSEIVLVIDNSYSMLNTLSNGQTRMQAVLSAAKSLVAELMSHNNVKVSVVTFSSANPVNMTYTDSNWIPEGTEQDARLRIALSDSSTSVINSITEIQTGQTGERTNIEAGLSIAKKQFSSENSNKYILLLTDGVPNLSLNGNTQNYEMVDVTNTKNAILNLKNEGIGLISVMTEQSNSTIQHTDMGEVTYVDIAERIFGTPSNPTYGKFYYIPDTKISKTVSQDVLSDFVPTTTDEGILRNIIIKDTFPQEIVDNFDFTYVQAPTKGTATQSINSANKLLTWSIPELGYGETASLSYKLKLKDSIDENIINVVLNTNTSVDITTDSIVNNGQKVPFTSSVTPKVRVKLLNGDTPPADDSDPDKPTPDNPTPDTPTPQKDPTVAKEKLPQTGATMTLSILMIVSITIAIITAKRAFIK